MIDTTDLILGPAESTEEVQRLLVILESPDATSEQISLALAILAERLNGDAPLTLQERTRLNHALARILCNTDNEMLKYKEE